MSTHISSVAGSTTLQDWSESTANRRSPSNLLSLGKCRALVIITLGWDSDTSVPSRESGRSRATGMKAATPKVGAQGIRRLIQLCIGCLLGAEDYCRSV